MSNDLNEHFDLPMISIKRTIEKLFGDEQFERAQHINFVIELLSSQQTDNCLDGLNLDCFDIDVEFQSNLPKPSVIPFSKRCWESSSCVSILLFWINCRIIF